MLGFRVAFVLRVVAMAFGLLLISLASLTYEDEENRLQSKVEDWWIQIDDKRTASLSWATLFIQGVARLTDRLFDRIFGKRLFSLRVVGVSILFSIASAFLSVSIFSFLGHNKIPSSSNLGMFAWFLRFSVFALLPAISESPSLPWKPWLPRLLRLFWYVLLIFLMLSVTSFLTFLAKSKSAITAQSAMNFLGLLFAIGFAFDVVYIAFTRWVLRRVSMTNRAAGILFWIFVQCFFLATLIVLPPYAGVKLFQHANVVGGAFLFSFFLNSVDVVAASAALILTVLLLVHRLIWPVLQRPLYAIQRFDVIRRKRWLWGLGVGLIAVAVPGLPTWLKGLLDKL